jgi:hypothetical protein
MPLQESASFRSRCSIIGHFPRTVRGLAQTQRAQLSAEMDDAEPDVLA